MGSFFYLHPRLTITFYGWHVGMRKVAFPQLLRAETGLNLKGAHESTLRVLDEQAVTVEVLDEQVAELLAQAEALGVKCRLEPPCVTW
jgi:hypothetical protein